MSDSAETRSFRLPNEITGKGRSLLRIAVVVASPSLSVYSDTTQVGFGHSGFPPLLLFAFPMGPCNTSFGNQMEFHRV